MTPQAIASEVLEAKAASNVTVRLRYDAARAGDRRLRPAFA
jgi:hypothetical protein